MCQCDFGTRLPFIEGTKMASRSQKLSLTFANLLIPIAILTFAVGFFPYKPFIPGLATYQQLGQYEALPEAPFDKVVFMVVDALRRLACLFARLAICDLLTRFQ